MAKDKKKRSEKFNEDPQVVDIKEEKKKRKQREKETPSLGYEESAQVRRRREQKRRRTFVYILVALGLLVIIGFSSYRVVLLKIEESKLKKEHARLEQIKKDKGEELQMVNDPEYIEQQARKQLRLIMPGETLYMLPSKEELGNAGNKGDNEN